MMKEYYGDNTRWFLAEVVDGSPPSGHEGMVRIRIRGIHSGNVNDIPQRDLPWASVMIPGTEPGVSGLGQNAQLMPGAQVFGLFMDGEGSQIPLVLGSVPRTEFPTSVQADNRDDISTNPFVYELNKQKLEFVLPNEVSRIDDVTILLREARTLCIKFFIDNGFNINQAAGISGVLETLTRLDPLYSQDIYVGIGSWNINSSRYQRLLNFAAAIGAEEKWTDLNVQLLFVLHELRTTHKVCAGKLYRSISYNENTTDMSVLHGKGSVNVFINNYLDKEVAQSLSSERAHTAAETAYNVVTN